MKKLFLISLWLMWTGVSVDVFGQSAHQNGKSFVFEPISEAEFRRAWSHNHNAVAAAEIAPGVDIEKEMGGYVFSKEGFWVGQRNDNGDYHLQLEICGLLDDGIYSIFRFEFTEIDICEKEPHPIFWAGENTVYIATMEYDHQGELWYRYYSIKFTL